MLMPFNAALQPSPLCSACTLFMRHWVCCACVPRAQLLCFVTTNYVPAPSPHLELAVNDVTKCQEE